MENATSFTLSCQQTFSVFESGIKSLTLNGRKLVVSVQSALRITGDILVKSLIFPSTRNRDDALLCLRNFGMA